MSLLVSPHLIARIACAGLAVNLAASMVESALVEPCPDAASDCKHPRKMADSAPVVRTVTHAPALI